MRRTAVAVVAALCAACGSGAGGASPSTEATGTPTSAAPVLPAVSGIAGAVVRLRTDVAIGGRVQVRVTNSGDEPFTVMSVALDSPGFTPLPPAAVTSEYAPGRVIDLPTPYGEPVCSTDPAPVAARLTVTRSGSAVEEVRLPLAGDDLDVVHREECGIAAVREVADVALTGLAGDGEEVTGTVVLTRRGNDDRAVTVSDVRRSVILDVAVDGLPLELAPGEREASAGVSFTTATCEPHVLAEVKQPFVFPLQVAVGDADAVPVPLPVDEAQRDLLWALVRRVCVAPD